MFLFHREVSNIPLDTVVVEGLVLVHLLNSIVIRHFCLCAVKLDLPGKQPQFLYPFQSACQIQNDASRESCPMTDCFYVLKVFPFPKGSLGSVATSPTRGIFEVVFPGALPFPRTPAGTGKPFFNPMFLLFYEQDQCWSFVVFGFPFHAPGVFSLVSCSLSFISSCGGLALSKNPHFHKAKVKMARTNNPRSIASIMTHNGIEKETFGVAQITDVLMAMLPSGSFSG